MGRLFAALAFADFALVVIAFIDCLSVEAEEIRTLPRAAWVFVILLFSPFGPILWFMYGRPAPALVARRAGGAPAAPWPGPKPEWDGEPEPRQVPPDDDPEFLRRISGRPASQAVQEDIDLLRAWEADLRRREEELRRQRPDDPPTDTASQN
jgi:hypothetical protein